jgi:nitrate reductase beta subunit
VFCYPRIEAGEPTVCSETCVGRIRYLGVMLYDADRIAEAASVEATTDLYQSQLDLFLDPHDPQVQAEALRQGIAQSWLDAAKRSPVYRMACEWKVAFPLHPEYRTLPMVWYVPPLSPIQSAADAGHMGMNGVIPDVKSLRIPMRYLANLLTAGDEAPIVSALNRMLAMRAFKRAQNVNNVNDDAVLNDVGLTASQVEEMYQLMAIANYEDRFVVPSSHKEMAQDSFDEKGSCGFSFGNCGSSGVSDGSLFGSRTHGEVSYAALPKSRKKALQEG